MNQDDIIRVAREAGFAEWYGTDDPQFLIVIEHFAALVAAHEREECAKLCEQWDATHPDRLAAAIRVRSEK